MNIIPTSRKRGRRPISSRTPRTRVTSAAGETVDCSHTGSHPCEQYCSAGAGKIRFSTRKLFLRAWLAEGCRNFLLLYARLRVAALPEILLFGAVTHHAGISNLASLLGLGPGFLRHA